MRSRSDDYRFNALNCLAIAEQITDPGTKALLIAMARSWYVLADQAERNSIQPIKDKSAEYGAGTSDGS